MSSADDLEVELKKWKLEFLRSATSNKDKSESTQEEQLAREVLKELISEYYDPLKLINLISPLHTSTSSPSSDLGNYSRYIQYYSLIMLLFSNRFIFC